MLTKKLFTEVVDILLPEMGDSGDRKALIERALFGCTVLQKIQWDGAARTFTTRLVGLLDEFGEIESGRPAITALLQEVKRQVGADRQSRIDDLLARLTRMTGLTGPVAKLLSEDTIQPPKKTVESDELYVFISYARPDRDAAERVETFLTTAGVRVFRDTSDIRAGEDWIVRIDRALRECSRMVLLLSPASMPYRKEVHLEWVFFDRERKPIYPLYLEDCDLLYRLRVYNYIDARANLESALERLLNDLRSEFAPPPKATAAEKINIIRSGATEALTVRESMEALGDALSHAAGDVVLSTDAALAIKDHKPVDLTEFRLGRIAEWSLPRYYLDKRFVNLTLILDKGEQEQQRWQRAEDSRFNELRDVLEKTRENPALVLLGAPGSGKSTLLRRLQLDHSVDRLRDGAEQISFFVQLNAYHSLSNAESDQPRKWLAARWAALYPRLAPFEDWLEQGRALLLLDALNEMPHKNTSHYHELVERWGAFAREAARQGNRIVFSCRSLDYSAVLSSSDLRVPQVEVQPMSPDQVREFLKVYVPAHEERIWNELDGSGQMELYRTPYFLSLLCEQVAATGEVANGRAALLTGFVRQALKRELNSDLLKLQGGLLDETDRQRLNLGKLGDFGLPDRGLLIPKLSDLAYHMQVSGLGTGSAQVRIDYDDARNQIAHEQADNILKAGIALNVLDEDLATVEIFFFHQLLQEYFAARKLAKQPKPELIHVEWETEKVSPSLQETLDALADGDPLPVLPQTGWEETTLTAGPIARDPETFIRDLISHNLPLAARCAASPEVKISDKLKAEIQQELIARTQDMNADLRARIAAGEALGMIGDPRFERRGGPYGEYLLPPLVEISGGQYPMGDDDGSYGDEKPGHIVELASFHIGKFPVTNAEYKLFIEAGGYKHEQWWDTQEARVWLSGEASTEGIKQQWREARKRVQGWEEDYIRGLVKQNRWTTEHAENWIMWCNWSDQQFDQALDDWHPSGRRYREPEFSDDTRFNNPSQPVVGVTWFEARAYCNWLTANARTDERMRDSIFRLPTEAEFEAAARGAKGRIFPYGNTFDVARSNTFESHIRRTTPVGVFGNATPEGALDLSGNAYTWTLSIYDQERFPYPYRKDDGREDIHQADVNRVLRGGSWLSVQVNARAVYRYDYHPSFRGNGIGFRVVSMVCPPSLSDL